jgi:hypothetical protein
MASHVKFDSGYAYLVAPVTLNIHQKWQAVTETGVITMTLRKGINRAHHRIRLGRPIEVDRTG